MFQEPVVFRYFCQISYLETYHYTAPYSEVNRLCRWYSIVRRCPLLPPTTTLVCQGGYECQEEGGRADDRTEPKIQHSLGEYVFELYLRCSWWWKWRLGSDVMQPCRWLPKFRENTQYPCLLKIAAKYSSETPVPTYVLDNTAPYILVRSLPNYRS